MKGSKCKYDLHDSSSEMLLFVLDINSIKDAQCFAYQRQRDREYFEAYENPNGKVTNI